MLNWLRKWVESKEDNSVVDRQRTKKKSFKLVINPSLIKSLPRWEQDTCGRRSPWARIMEKKNINDKTQRWAAKIHFSNLASQLNRYPASFLLFAISFHELIKKYSWRGLGYRNLSDLNFSRSRLRRNRILLPQGRKWLTHGWTNASPKVFFWFWQPSISVSIPLSHETWEFGNCRLLRLFNLPQASDGKDRHQLGSQKNLRYLQTHQQGHRSSD